VQLPPVRRGDGSFGSSKSHVQPDWTNLELISCISIPPGAIMIVLIMYIFPKNIGRQKLSGSWLAHIDWLGIILSLAGSVLLVFALESGGSQYSWDSAIIIVTF
jgi:hypothetical protein